MSRVFLDTNIFIYFIEDEGKLGRMAFELFEKLSLRRDEVLTSTLTLGEILTQPMAMGRQDLVTRYEEALNSTGVRMLSFDRMAAREYARVRRDKTIRAPDALQLSVAASAGCDLFVTNDKQLTTKIVPGIQFITALEKVPL
jgi:predicted nucleic acid-binding protein